MTDDPFKVAIDRMLAESYERMADGVIYDPDRPGVFYMNSTAPAITVHKHAAYLKLSTDQLLDAGLITEDAALAQGWTPPPPPSRRSRLRWRWQAWRERVGRKVGGWLAGVDLSERDEDW